MPRKYVRSGKFALGKRAAHKPEREATDLGTPELRKRRMEALGPQREGWPKPDLTDSVTALGMFLWQGFLHPNFDRAKKMHDAGVLFATWWTIVHPKTHTQGTLGQFSPKGAKVDIDPEEAEANLAAVSAFLGKETRVLHTVINVAVYQNPEHRRLDKLRAGLCRLIEWQRSAEAETIRRRFDKKEAAE
jgi:hypothetical protein